MLVIGAGGAGLRAAIEASAAGATVGLVCKSLLGKAHTVMAEGGVAAALANVDERDSWQVHFADTMRGGQYLNNWRMAELHAKEAPDRVRELEAWGALFDRTAGRPHPAAQLRRPPLSAPGARRRPHRPGDDPHAAGPRHPPGHRRPHGVHGHRAAQGRRPRRRAPSATTASAGRFTVFRAKAVVLATGGIGRAYSITSNSWEYTGDGHALAYDAGRRAAWTWSSCSSIPPAWSGRRSVRGHPGHRGRARRGRRPAQQRRPALHVRRHPGELHAARPPTTRRRAGATCQGDKNARRPPELLTRDHVARCIMREVREGRGSPHGGVFLDIAWIKERLPERRGAHQEEAAEHVPPVQAAGRTSTSPRSRWRSGPTTHYMMGGVRVDAETPDVHGARACSPPASAAAGLHGANRLGGNSLSDLLVFGKRAGEYAARVRAASSGAGDDRRRRRSTRRRAAALAPFERDGERRRRGPVRRSSTTCRSMMQDLVGIVRTRGRRWSRPSRASPRCASAPRRVRRRRQPRVQPGLAHRARPAEPARPSPRRSPAPRIERKESRGAHFRDDYPEKDAAFGKVNLVVRKGRDGAMQVDAASRSRRCRAGAAGRSSRR